MRKIIPILMSLLIFGCSSSPSYNYEPGVQPSLPSNVGNSLSTRLLTVTTPVTFSAASTIVCNLNITLDAIVNPTQESTFNPTDVRDILMRAESRIAARVVEVITADPELNINRLDSLRASIRNASQDSFNQMYENWQFAEDFKVEIVVTSISLSQPLSSSISAYSSWR